jgi:hypothetical protein
MFFASPGQPQYIARLEGVKIFMQRLSTGHLPEVPGVRKTNQTGSEKQELNPKRREASDAQTKLAQRGRFNDYVEISCGNITWRLEIWKISLQQSMASPIWGNGFAKPIEYGGVTRLQRVGFAQDSGVTPTHNELLTVFYKMGFLGLLLFLWINGFVFFQGLQRSSLCREPLHKVCLLGALGGLIVWHVMAQFFDLIDSPPTNIFLWMLLGFILSLSFKKD